MSVLHWILEVPCQVLMSDHSKEQLWNMFFQVRCFTILWGLSLHWNVLLFSSGRLRGRWCKNIQHVHRSLAPGNHNTAKLLYVNLFLAFNTMQLHTWAEFPWWIVSTFTNRGCWSITFFTPTAASPPSQTASWWKLLMTPLRALRFLITP